MNLKGLKQLLEPFFSPEYEKHSRITWHATKCG